jgi:electron transfer flavoprotein alpha subunit
VILVVAEFEAGKLKKATLELISAARGLGKDGGVTALLLGPNAGSVAEETAKYADQVLIASDANLEPFVPSVIAQAIQQIALEGEAHTVLIAGSRVGREVAPRLAVRLDAPYLEDAVKLEGIDGGLRMTHYAYLARVTETLEATAPVIVASVKPNTQTPAEPTGNTGEIFEVELEITPSAVKILGRTQEKSSRVPLTEATVVVTGGRGMGSPENFALIEALADVVGAGVGATRAAVDAGWRPYAEQVGQTGKTVQPNAYICAGVSGAVQHLSGMGKSKFIVAINKDAEAPIFKVADYGIIGDLNTILPAMIEAAKKLRD